MDSHDALTGWNDILAGKPVTPETEQAAVALMGNTETGVSVRDAIAYILTPRLSADIPTEFIQPHLDVLDTPDLATAREALHRLTEQYESQDLLCLYARLIVEMDADPELDPFKAHGSMAEQIVPILQRSVEVGERLEAGPHRLTHLLLTTVQLGRVLSKAGG